MKIRKLLGEKVAILPVIQPSERVTASGIIIPKTAKDPNSHLCEGVVVAKGNGTPWNNMKEIRVGERVYYKKGSGEPYTEMNEKGDEVKYILIKFGELLKVSQ